VVEGNKLNVPAGDENLKGRASTRALDRREGNHKVQRGRYKKEKNGSLVPEVNGLDWIPKFTERRGFKKLGGTAYNREVGKQDD